MGLIQWQQAQDQHVRRSLLWILFAVVLLSGMAAGLDRLVLMLCN